MNTCVCALKHAVCVCNVCMHFFVLLLRKANNSVILSQLNRNRPTNTLIKVTDKQMCSGMHTGMCVCDGTSSFKAMRLSVCRKICVSMNLLLRKL